MICKNKGLWQTPHTHTHKMRESEQIKIMYEYVWYTLDNVAMRGEGVVRVWMGHHNTNTSRAG